MPRFILYLLATLQLFAFQPQAQAQDRDIPANPVLMQAQVFNESGKRYLALSYQNVPDWHTYWKNPGDAGLPFKNEFKQNGKKVNLIELEWPAPKTFMAEGDILGYGYEGEYSLFYLLPNELTGDFEVDSKWLVCKHICIPGSAHIKGKLGPSALLIGAEKFKVTEKELKTRFTNLPQNVTAVEGLQIELIKGDGKDELKLVYQWPKKGIPSEHQNLLMPFLQAPFDFKREKISRDDELIQGSFSIAWDGKYEDPVQELDAAGHLPQDYQLKFLLRNPEDGKVLAFEKTFKEVKKAPSFALITASNSNPPASSSSALTSNLESGGTSFLAILFFAFIGGLILNIMPCVLPVISLKLFGLLRHSNESKRQIFRHNISYSLGVLTTFLALAGAVLAIKYSGEAVGWGFQLQSPVFVALMVIIIFTMALNLFGLFEFATPGGRQLGGVALKDSFVGDFFGGVLATILSTPCSAPFLGTALTVAFSSGPLTISAIFLMIGLGLSFPFLLTAFFPALIRFLPRPGIWMEHVKKFLGLLLVLTTLWLLDVFGALIDGSLPLLKLQSALVFIFFAFYAYKKILKGKISRFAVALIPFLLLLSLFTAPLNSSDSTTGSKLLVDKIQSGLPWEEWSEQKMTTFQQEGTRTFIDFTAKWCFTCKVNEKLVLDTSDFKALQQKYEAKLLLADWTKKDPLITTFLEKNNLVGVPAYFVIDSKGAIHNLGETITIAEIERAIAN